MRLDACGGVGGGEEGISMSRPNITEPKYVAVTESGGSCVWCGSPWERPVGPIAVTGQTTAGKRGELLLSGVTHRL